MAKINYTPAQDAAIHWHGGNLLLSAAAGSGKTATLTGRILWLLEQEDVSIREMCIVTYTRAAAAELRERIAARLRERVRETGSRRLMGQLAELGSAEISTIHAFLYRNLRPMFPSLGLSPDFVIGDEAIMAELRADAMAEIVDECFDQENENRPDGLDFVTLADTLSAARDMQSLDKTLLAIHGALRSAGRSPTDLSQYAAALDNGDTGADFFSMAQSSMIRERLSAAVGHFRSAISDVRMAFTPEVEAKYGPSAEAFLDWMVRIEAAMDSYTGVRDALSDDRLPRLATIQSKNATEASIRFRALRDEGKKAFAALRNSLFVFAPEAIRDTCARTAGLLRSLEAVLTAFDERYQMKKRAKGLLDYEDLERFALSLYLDANGAPTAAAAEVAKRYRYIFIDEYQDTNDVQDAIFRAISGNARRFLVGDVKQSIYRFRGADPAVFSRYRDRWTVLSPVEAAKIPEDTPFSPDDGASIFMSENFRCDRPVIELVNLVSALLFPHGAIPYTDDDALVMGKIESRDEAAEICLIEQTGKTPSESDGEEAEDDTAPSDEEDPEAAYVADRIREYLINGLSDGTPVTPGDIAILLRSPELSGEKYRAALTSRHIPVTTPNADPLFLSPAVLLALCMAYTADNPLRDIYVAGALHSPLFGLTTMELSCIHKSVHGTEIPLYIAIEAAVWPEKYAADEQVTETDRTALPPETIDKLRRFCEALPELRGWSRDLTADQFFERLFTVYRFYELPEIAGDPIEARNLQSFYELSRRHGSGGIGSFLQITETLQNNARQENDAVSGVTLTSIHKSKGLEYPIVFVPECAKKRNARDENAEILFDPALGFGLRLPDPGGYVRCNTILRAAIAEKKRMESVAEEMRVFYVALTRAKTKLICTAKVKDPEAFLDKYRTEAAYPTKYRITTSDTYIEWLLLAAFSDLPSRLREIRIVAGVGSAEAAAETTGTDPGNDGMATDDTEALSDAENPAGQFPYPTPEYASIPAKVSVSALHPGVVDEWLARGGAAHATDPADTENDTAAEEKTAETEENTQITTATAEDVPTSGLYDTEDVLAKAIRSHTPLPCFLTGLGDIRTPADRGTATHMFLQFTDLTLLWENGVDAELKRLVDAHYLTQTAAAAVYRGQLMRFRESELFDRMRASRAIWREFRFNASMDAARFTNNPVLRDKLAADGITLTVQGVVDCVFREPDGSLTLVDYKTDRASADDRANPAAFAEKLRLRHRNQLTYYHEICEAMFGEPITRTVLYATSAGCEIDV